MGWGWKFGGNGRGWIGWMGELDGGILSEEFLNAWFI